jgi:uncharacterized protein with NRDE domain
MCLLLVASRAVPGVPLLVGANRDEYLDRPSDAVAVLDVGPPRILGGRDLRAGGTWFAVNEAGVCAGLTNQPLGDALDRSKRSRGALPIALTRFTTAEEAVDQFVRTFDPSDFNGCWLLVGDRSSLYFVDFTGSGPDAGPYPGLGPGQKAGTVATSLGPGVYVLENRSLGAPSPKVDLVLEAVGQPDDAAATEARFRAVLADHRIPPEDERPTAGSCVHLDGYGTRSSCLVEVTDDLAAAPRVLVANGPPCVTPFEDVTSMWDERAQSPRHPIF